MGSSFFYAMNYDSDNDYGKRITSISIHLFGDWGLPPPMLKLLNYLNYLIA